jgi:hypothetical protein
MPSGPTVGTASVLAVTSGSVSAALLSTHKPWIAAADEDEMASLRARLPVQARVAPSTLTFETSKSSALNSALNWSRVRVSQIVRSSAVEM